ncbi:hypothetical protein ACG04R_28620, partial [Roseateles sp. BYS78W]
MTEMTGHDAEIGGHVGPKYAAQGSAATGDAYVPLSFELGEAFQFDWSEEPLVIGGVYQRLQV